MSKKIKLLSIKLQDWRSINAEVNFNDGHTTIKGRNGCGKSSIFHAFTWLLTSHTDYTNGKNVELFDNTKPITEDTPAAAVTMNITIDGVPHTLTRTARPVFVRDRETGEYTKASSDKYRTFINGVECSATDFNKWIEYNICPTNMLTFCIDGNFFANLSLEDRRKARKVLDTIVGEVTDADFERDYSKLKEAIGIYSIDDFVKLRRSEIKEFENEKAKITANIEMIQNAHKRNREESEKVKAEIEKLEEDIKLAGDDEEFKSLQLLKSKRHGLITQRSSVITNRDIEASRELTIARNNNEAKRRSNDDKKAQIGRIETWIADEEKLLGALIIEKERLLGSIKSLEEANSSTIDRCEVCGHIFSEEEKEERSASTKLNNMLAINSLRESLKGIEERISNSRQSIEDFKKQIELYSNFEVEDDLVSVLSEINKKYDEKVKDELDAFQDEIDALDRQINEAEKTFGNGLSAMYEKLHLLYKRLGNLEGDNDAFDVPSLETQRRELSNKIALYYKDLHYCDMWFDERADIVSRRINSLLSDCKISMWSFLKNGDRVPDCVITNNDGVTYSTLNTAHRIKTCIALQKMFCKHYGIELPIFVDEASVFDSENLPKDESQIIYLLASDNETITIL